MVYENEELILSTGKRIGANCNIIGINPDLELFEGYDGELNPVRYNSVTDNLEPTLTAEEIVELSQYMIDLWTKCAQKQGNVRAI